MTLCGTKCCLITAVLVVVVAWILSIYSWPYTVRQGRPVPPVSYDGRIHFDLSNVQEPITENAIKSIVKDAYDNDRKIRVLGSGHSWSKVAQTTDIMISLSKYIGPVSIDRENLRATFKAGTSLRDISLVLEDEGLAMLNLGSVAYQSIAGAISTATHGTGLTVGNLASLVTKLKFVSGKGEIVTVSEDDENTDDFKAAQVNIGMFGVLTEVTVKVDHAFNLEEFRTHTTLDDCLENLKDLVEDSGFQYVKFWVEFYNNLCVVYRTRRTTLRVKDPPSDLLAFLTYYSFAIATRITYLIPQLTPLTMCLVGWIGFSENTHRVDTSYKIFNDYFELPIHQEGEIIVAYEHTVAAIRAVEAVVKDNRYPVNYITEVRFVAGDNIWLSPEASPSNRPWCAITLTIYADKQTVEEYFNACYNATAHLSIRYHWGKHFPADTDPADIKVMYPKYNKFASIREKMDPKGVFLNPLLEETFGFSGEETFSFKEEKSS